jgi:hypothetical protein
MACATRRSRLSSFMHDCARMDQTFPFWVQHFAPVLPGYSLQFSILCLSISHLPRISFVPYRYVVDTEGIRNRYGTDTEQRGGAPTEKRGKMVGEAKVCLAKARIPYRAGYTIPWANKECAAGRLLGFRNNLAEFPLRKCLDRCILPNVTFAAKRFHATKRKRSELIKQFIAQQLIH